MNEADCFLTVDELGNRYAAGTLTPTSIAILHLQRIARLEPTLNAFQLIDADGALQAAAASTARWQAGQPIGPLDGVTVTIKDNVDIAGLPTRHGSRTSEDKPAEADSPVVTRLREAGSIILGKTRLPEFGWKALTDGPLQDGPTRNPWDPGRTPGGSSGGGAACVAAGVGTFAFGNDGGGSIRIPASFCGLFGIKPTFGRVPHHPQEGVFATLVSGGPMTRTVAEAVTVLDVMARPDDRDWFALPPPEAGWLAGLAPKLAGLRLAYSPEFGGIAPDPDVRAGIETALASLRAAGAEIAEVGPVIGDLKTTFNAFWLAGFAGRLRSIPRERWDELDPQFRAVAEGGLDVDIDALLKGESARAALGRELAAFHRDFDLLITPTMPRVAAPVETVYHSQGYDRWRDGVPYTLPFNLTGLPAATLPCGLSRDGLPIGLQVSGPKYSERLILEACLAIEERLAFAQPHPVLMASLGKLG